MSVVLESEGAEQGFHAETVAHDELTRDGGKAEYFTFRVT